MDTRLRGCDDEAVIQFMNDYMTSF